MKNNYSFDKIFLNELFKVRDKVVYAKVISLTRDEYPVQEITGLLTGGSINVDGTSAVRSSVSLTLMPFDKADYSWATKTKIKLEIGLKNTINSNYPDIVWFPQGTYIISSFSQSESPTGTTISISGKDKMCLLNGEMGGTIKDNSVEFDKIYHTDGSYEKYVIKDIIYDIINKYAYEPARNIVIENLDDYGLELLEYRGDGMYIFFKPETKDMYKVSFNGSDKVNFGSKTVKLSQLEKTSGFVFDNGFSDQFFAETPSLVSPAGSEEKCSIAKISYGETAGYRLTDLTYPGDLTAKAGETITSVLDKIVKMLGDFEYFYDFDGKFIFRRKKLYVNVSWNNTSNVQGGYKEDFIFPESQVSEVFQIFDGQDQITSLSLTPDISKVKNDYTIWGTRKSVSGAEIPVHIRYAIDQKPTLYTTISVGEDDVKEMKKVFNVTSSEQTSIAYGTSLTKPSNIPSGTKYYSCDWREIIYRMALDYRKYGRLDNFYLKVKQKNPQFLNGLTGYEQYYTDLEGFWRQLYYPTSVRDSEKKDKSNKFKTEWLAKFKSKGIKKDGSRTAQLVKDNATLNEYITAYNAILKDKTTLEKTKAFLKEQVKQFYNAEKDKAKASLSDEKSQAAKKKSSQTKTKNSSAKKAETDYNAAIKRLQGDYDKTIKTLQQEKKKRDTEIDNLYTTAHRGMYKNLNPNWFNKINPTSLKTTISSSESKTVSKSYFKQVATTGEDPYKLGSAVFKNIGTLIEEYQKAVDDLSAYEQKQKSDAENYRSDGWCKALFDSPTTLNFWMDFLDTKGEISEFSVRNIGMRDKVSTDSATKNIQFKATPKIIYYKDQSDKDKKSGYKYCRVTDDVYNLFSISSQGKSAWEELNTQLYQNSFCTEAVSMTTFPIYWLEPNVKIELKNNGKYDGKYSITKYTIPLGHNGTMSLSLAKDTTRLL